MKTSKCSGPWLRRPAGSTLLAMLRHTLRLLPAGRIEPTTIAPTRIGGFPAFAFFSLTLTLTFTVAPQAHAQFEIRGATFSRLFLGTVPDAGSPPVITPQFAADYPNSGGSGGIAATGDLSARFPSQIYVNSVTSVPTGVAIVLLRSTSGSALAPGVPRYALGDLITPPTTQDGGVLAADSNYWRIQPVLPGETFAGISGTPVAADFVPAYYFSPHAQKVFASQSGRVTVTWVTRVPVTTDTDTNLLYRFRTETFAVSITTQRPVRTIYWTERGFNGPLVNVPAGKIETINPIYSANFPATVAQEYKAVGVTAPADPNAAPPAEKRTLWFEKVAGIGQLHAYNLEGRIMIEYLGALLSGTVHQFLGADIVEVVRVAAPIDVNVSLGDQLTPRDSDGRPLPLDGSSEWLASPVTSSSGGTGDSQPFYGTVTRKDGRRTYYAERENLAPERVAFYWLERSDASIHFLSAPSVPDLGMHWPKVRNHYVQVWPTDVTKFAHYTVAGTGSTAATGIPFAGGQVPQVVFQDDPTQAESRIENTNQRLVVSVAGDGLNRSLLKFTGTNEVWYVRVFTQSDTRSAFQEGDALASINATAFVGDRINAPAGYETGGYIASGTGYLPAAYADPFAVGMTAAARRAIIPVNAVPGANVLKVWWFKKIEPPSATFQPFFVPAKIGTYTVAYPTNPSTIVLAANDGSGDLSPAEIGGSLYVQNDRTQPGFNPNEEHALLIAGRAYAIRDDLNNTSSDPAAYTSQPFVLLHYTHPTDSRPAMRAFKVLRELDLPGTAGDKLFNYPIAAGTMVQPPMPLPLLPLAVAPNGDIPNTEVAGLADIAPHNTSPGHYGSFTLEDRKGFTWAYRGPHGPLPVNSLAIGSGGSGYTSAPDVTIASPGGSGVTATATATVSDGTVVALTIVNPGSGYTSAPTVSFANGGGSGATATAIVGPTFGMQFYYPMREGFFIPGLGTQPAVGTVLPYLRPLASGAPAGDPVTGTSLTITYRPVWPANSPELRVAETLTLPKFGLPAVLTQTSAHVLYQQSIAALGTTKPSVTLHDPVREKTFAFGGAGALAELPPSVITSSYQGKTYFQNSPPHLQDRFYFDPNRGTKGALVLLGKFVDEIAGEDFIKLNVLSAEDIATLKALCKTTDTVNQNKTKWDAAIDGLATKVETFIENPARPGTYIPGPSPVTVPVAELAKIANSDTAVVNYALTATGYGSGWVSMIFGNGEAFTPEGEPVSVAVFRVAPRLYTGEIKVQPSSNPLDEQVSMQHSGDFAANPGDYEFDWRYAPPQGGVAPPIYTFSMTPVAATTWRFAANPAGALPTSAEYAAAPAAVSLPFSLPIRTEAARAATLPGRVARATAALDFSSGVPGRIVFSADLSDSNAGFVLYVNGGAALAHQAPAGFTNALAGTGLVSGALAKQFEVDGNYFQVGQNTLELALFTTSVSGFSGSVNVRFDVSTETDQVLASGTPWTAPNGTLSNVVLVGGNPAAPLGSPLLVMSDNYFTMRYRPKINKGNILAAGSDQSAVGWSRWMRPALVEGWIKRVLAGINPFNQRVGDLYNNAVNTDVSLLTQAGKRWEGDISLNLANINSFGLIEIYETVLNRGKNISIDSGFDYAPANDALLLAAGYLNDLYTILGNEAYADAANPTISVDDSSSSTEINTSRFSFESQVRTVLEEELALLRGRDDFLAPGVTVSPAYNRLYWNFTRGINSGEALYAVNYNIREKAGSSTADGKIDAADAQRMFPQGHGDAYGHFLTALKGYTRLLQSPNFTWTPRTEAVTVLGQAIQVDYVDERKFAAAAANLARTAQQVLALTHRQAYKDNPALGWAHYRDNTTNSSTGVTRHFGVDEWTARATQGAYFNWLVGNAILPDVDNNPQHTGIQIVDRTTVPELRELPTLAEDFQVRIDNVNAHLNPLGLSPAAIAFDISPTELKAGKSHYDQIHDRALRAVLNAKGAFDQAAKMTRLLRNQENQLAGSSDAIDDQEGAFNDSLVEIYGQPYPGDIGAGKTYAQGYTGPDLFRWFIIDRPSDLVDTTAPVNITVKVPVGFKEFSLFQAADVKAFYDSRTGATDTATLVDRSITVHPGQFAQFADVVARSAGALGTRTVVGSLQQALSDFQVEYVAFRAATDALLAKRSAFVRSFTLYSEMVTARTTAVGKQAASDAEILRLAKVRQNMIAEANRLIAVADTISNAAHSTAEFFPKVFGLANDATSGPRAGVLLGATILADLVKIAATASLSNADLQEVNILEEEQKLAKELEALGFGYEQKQFALEYEMQYRELVSSHFELTQLAASAQRAAENVRNLVAAGEKLQADRETFRQRAAAVIQGYRTKDLTFRTFRNEALEQYRSLYDLAARYTYLSAKSYDYETGLLGTTAGQSVIDAIVASRALGDLTGGQPQATVSTLGDAGLAGTMARLQADWSVAKPRLGINNPDTNGTLFSLRRELFRLLPDATGDTPWQQTLEQHIMTDILADADVAAGARNLRKPDGSAVPGIVIPFSTTIQHGKNFFGLPFAAGDHNYSPSNFATKIYSVGAVLRGYIGMDPFAAGTPNAGTPNSTAPNALGATPYIYLIPVGADYMLAPPLGDTGATRTFMVRDQALPLPFNLGATQFSTTQFFNANGTLSEQPWILRKHQAFRPVSDPAFFYSTVPAEFTSSRLVGRSVWNGSWKLVIPAYTLLNNEQDALNRFVASVKDIEIFLRTYSHSGN
jgi:hypothetical protein